jgi:4-hydroxybenzoate polyprenyltransferase
VVLRSIGLVRLSHAFPSALNALATSAITLVAGGAPTTAVQLGAAMLCLQASIGAVNDLADAEFDRVGKPAKPIPAGLVSPRLARAWAVLAAAAGLLLAVPSGVLVFGVACAGLGLGYLYDLRLSRTALSWLPLALALPLVPIFAWLGARGELAPGLLLLVPIATLAGGALMIANGLVDVERDLLAGKPTVAVAISRGRAWLVHLVAFAVAIGLVIALGPDAAGHGGLGPASPATPTSPAGLPLEPGAASLFRAAASAGIPLGAVLIGLGAALVAARPPGVRERGWELEAIGTAVLGLGWLAGIAVATGRGG